MRPPLGFAEFVSSWWLKPQRRLMHGTESHSRSQSSRALGQEVNKRIAKVMVVCRDDLFS